MNKTSIRVATGNSSLGTVLVAATDKGVCAILIGSDAETLVHDLRDRFRHAELVSGDDSFTALMAKAIGVVDAVASDADLPLDMQGTEFQKQVWRQLRQIPSGVTASYGDIASRLGMPGAVRAVAQACARNPIAIAVPCHRVIRSDGALSGYRWGVARKRALLQREGAACAT